MQLPYFYTQEAITTSQGVLNEETSKHVSQVLRMQRSDQLQLTDGRGTLQTASIIEPHKKHTSVKIIESSILPGYKNKIIIGISPLKMISRFEWFLEKATELGVTEIIPLKCERTERQQFRHERMQHILVAGMIQSRQVWLPKFSEIKRFDQVVLKNTSTNKFIAHCVDEPKQTLVECLQKAQGDRIILIGPEGDFSAKEIDLAQSNKFIGVSLGVTRLRTETAGMTACVLMNAL
ncbi:MAG: 16S rRNA (uracil(1498)-N(3))-methyltransferase [Ginsengibacter sp.]